jgi:hypothetical protein
MAKRFGGETSAAKMISEAMVEDVAEDTAEIELLKLQKKIAREERKRRREIEASKQKKAVWLLPTLLFLTMLVSWVFSQLGFVNS